MSNEQKKTIAYHCLAAAYLLILIVIDGLLP